MAYVIAEPCVDVMDQACVDVCPVDCIHFEEGKDRMLYIEPDECIDCGACEPECPVEAIFTEEDVPDEWKPYTEINVLWCNDKDAARAKVGEIRPEYTVETLTAWWSRTCRVSSSALPQLWVSLPPWLPA